MVDFIVTDETAFDVAELIARDPASTVEEYAAAAAVLAQSPDWMQRSLGREIRAGLYAQPGAELCSEHSASVQRCISLQPEVEQADLPARPAFTPAFSSWRRDLAIAIAFIAGFAAVMRWFGLL